MELSTITKSIIAFCTLVVSVGTPIMNMDLHWLPQGVANTIAIVVGAAGLIVHYLTPNTTINPSVAASQSVKLVPPRGKKRVAKNTPSV